MNVVVLLLSCVIVPLACLVGALGLTRMRKDRRTLRIYERECLSQMPPPLPRQDDRKARSSNDASPWFTAALLGPVKGADQCGAEGDGEGGHPSHLTSFLDALLQLALRVSGLSLLMANQQELKVSVATVCENIKMKESAIKRELMPQHQDTWNEDADDGSFDSDDSYDADSFQDAEDEAYSEQEDAFDAEIQAENEAQKMLFDGLQFYTVLTQVGTATVRSVVQQAVMNTIESVARARAQEKQNASISVIEQRYPDILCLSAPTYLQHTTRADLATALLAVTAAMQQQELCGAMQRRLSIKRPDSLLLAQEDGMEPVRRTPLTSPSSSTTTAQLESSFLKAA